MPLSPRMRKVFHYIGYIDAITLGIAPIYRHPMNDIPAALRIPLVTLKILGTVLLYRCSTRTAPYASRALGELEKDGTIDRGRGVITIVDRGKLERQGLRMLRPYPRPFDRLLAVSMPDGVSI